MCQNGWQCLVGFWQLCAFESSSSESRVLMVPHFLERRGTIHFAKRVKFAKLINRWALGAVVSAFVSHAKGREFESHSAHFREKVNFLFAASLRSATKLNGILGEKISRRFCKTWFEPIFFRNVVISG